MSQPDTIVTAVEFNPDGPDPFIDVIYAEANEQGNGVFIGKKLTVMLQQVPADVQERASSLHEMVRDFVDAALVAQRNPPDSIPSKRRLDDDE